jgi:tRNA (guanine-N7-)-methyltransferase
LRQRHIKNATEENMTLMGVQFEVKRVFLSPERKVHVEIGSGKGQFITSLAKDYPEIQFVAIEKDIDVCYRIAEKKVLYELDNLTIINLDAVHLDMLFEPKSIDQIYLNFSDPWPKKKHQKRRLTAKFYISVYQRLLKPGGIIQCRTDHYDFFIDSMDTLGQAFHLENVDFNYPITPYMTEYEEKKRASGPIYQLRGTLNHDSPTLS